jgi:hypothetical protein
MLYVFAQDFTVLRHYLKHAENLVMDMAVKMEHNDWFE